MTKKILKLPVKRKYFEQIKAGSKKHEYRLQTEYWMKRIVGQVFDEVHITLGYPKKGDPERTIVRPWKGFTWQTVLHEHFGNEPAEVYAIRVN